ncbi:MAG: GDP-mannose 4,6-dehydratase [Pelagibacteraceae bacterium TMED216]|nr:MAG: GDP-mannose 4,6-dehydratase [Pelagibacteraceae bacterium TMED216]
MKKAFLTGITGQDGYYLTKLLLEKDYEVSGIIRRASSFNTSRIDPLISKYSKENRLNLYYSDLIDSSSLNNLISSIMPDEVYNLAAQSHVAVSFENPIYTIEANNLGTISLLEAIKNIDNNIRFYQASSSEMFGGEQEEMLNEDSPFVPKSPYAVSKVFSYHMTKVYRESYGMFATNGILFNHESPHRGETFVTRKITRAVGRIAVGIQSKITLGNIEASRDWGFAGDYVEAMWKILNHDKPDDWVIATGESHTIKEFLELAFQHVNLNYEDFIEVSEKYYRPNEVGYLLGDPKKAMNKLGWKPRTNFKELVTMMLENDIEIAKSEKILIEKGLLEPSWENYLIP